MKPQKELLWVTIALPNKASGKVLSSLYSKVDKLYFKSSMQINNEIALLILMCVLSTTTHWIAG